MTNQRKTGGRRDAGLRRQGIAGLCLILLLVANCKRRPEAVQGDTVPLDQAGSVLEAPQPGSAPIQVAVAPPAPEGAGNVLEFSWVAAPGRKLVWAQALINDQLAGENACFLQWEPGSNGLYLMNDSATALLGPIPAGGSSVLTNKRCAVGGERMRIRNGQRVEIAVPITIRRPSEKPLQIFMRAEDDHGNTIPWQPVGNWTVD